MVRARCMLISLRLSLVAVPITLASSDWLDCDVNVSTNDGPYEHRFLSTVIQEQQLFVQYPASTLPSSHSGWPVVFFMHALNLGYEWYQPQMERLASHGIVAVFPFIHSQFEDDHVKPAADDTSGKNLEAALEIVRKGLLPDIKVDNANIAFAGHNMGAVSAIRVAAKQPKGTVKLVIAMHPFPCDLGPPPYPYTVSSKEIEDAGNNADILYTTSEDDNAFGPWVAAREKKCFGNAGGNAIFVNFKQAACSGAFPDCKDVPDNGPFGAVDCKIKLHPFGKGHMCPTSVPGYPKFISPEAKWLVTALRASLQHGTVSKCYAQLWRSDADSLSADPNVADKVVQRKASEIRVLV